MLTLTTRTGHRRAVCGPFPIPEDKPCPYPARMTATARLAAAIGALAMLGALGATFAPASSHGVDCGTWIGPDWTEESTTALVESAYRTETLARATGNAAAVIRAGVMRDRALAAATDCQDVLADRRTLTLALAGVGIVGPAAVLWVGAGRRRDDHRDTAPTPNHHAPTGTDL